MILKHRKEKQLRNNTKEETQELTKQPIMIMYA
jgi:hypothetical protein